MKVAAAIITCPKNKKVLMSQRAKGDSHEGYWEFPGGKLVAGETYEEALIRELKEELNIKVVDFEIFTKLNYAYSSFTVNLTFFHVKSYTGTPRIMEQQLALDWLELNNLHKFKLLEANHHILDKLLNILPTLNR